MAKKGTIITTCPHCGHNINLEALAGDLKQAADEVDQTAAVLEKAANQLKRGLANTHDSVAYCCEAAFTVSAEELPSEEAFR